MKYHIIPVTKLKQNCSLIWCEQTGEAAVVDPGGEAQRLYEEITRLGIRITKILLTHAHLDHVGAAVELKQHYNVPILGPHIDDKPLLENLPKQCLKFGIPDINVFFPNKWLQNGEMLTIGKESFKILHCPGHSPGHIVIWNNKANGIIIMGDVLFRGSIGRTDLPGGNKETLIRSIYQQLMPLADNVIFLPGHGKISTIGHERRNNPFL